MGIRPGGSSVGPRSAPFRHLDVLLFFSRSIGSCRAPEGNDNSDLGHSWLHTVVIGVISYYLRSLNGIHNMMYVDCLV